MTVETDREPRESSLGGSLASTRGGGAWARLRRASPIPLQITEATGPGASLRRDALYRRLLLTADAIAVTAGFLIAARLSAHPLHVSWLGLLALPLVLVGAKVCGLYDRDAVLLRKTTLDEVPRLFQLATLCAFLGWLAGGLVMSGHLQRGTVLILWVALVVLVVAARAGARMLALNLSPIERCLFIGDKKSARMIHSKLSSHGGVKATLVAHLDLDKISPWSVDTFSSARLAEIRERVQALDVHRAIVAPRSADAGETLDLVRTLKAVGVRVSVLPRLLEVVGSSTEFDDLHGVPMMGVRRFELTRSSALVKRAFDLAGACVGLVVAAPLMLAIAVAIKLDSRGPVLFRQVRVGRYGHRFGMFKLRTMVEDAEALKPMLADRNEACAGMFKIADDPRVTRVGRLLRKSALDELPQLLNIVRGEMSLVGPRPLVAEEDRQIAGWYRRRLELLPGMTGQWQILGPTRVTLEEMQAIDYLYVANWSLWTDVKILLRTVVHVLARRAL
jgi:exopolysaccharide biosynthesis polyprenyl glycosylphosphotransferase